MALVKTTIIRKSIYYHDKVKDRHLRKCEGPCQYCGTVITTTAMGTEEEVERAHLCDGCKVSHQAQ